MVKTDKVVFSHLTLSLIPFALSLLLLFVISLNNFLIFHTLAELFSVFVAFGLFIVIWNTKETVNNDALIFLGIAYLFIGFVDLFHTLSYKGMSLFGSELDANPATQLWIIARYMESLSLCVFPLLLGKKIKSTISMGIYFTVTAIFLLMVFYWKIFPGCYIEGIGLTAFKKNSEYIISFLLICALFLLHSKRKSFEKSVFYLLAVSILLTVIGELAFTYYIDVYGISNLIGHFFKIISFYLVYKALIFTGLKKPFALLYKEISDKEKQYRQIFETNRAIKLIIDPIEGSIIEANNAACTFYGYSKKDLLSKNISDINTLPENQLAEEFKQATTEEKMYFNFSHRLSSGEIRDVEVYTGPIKYGDNNYIYSIIHDITERKKSELALLKSSQLNQQIIIGAHEGIIVYGLDLSYKIWNPFMENFSGLRADNVLGKHPPEVFPFLYESGVYERLKKALQGEITNPVEFYFDTGKRSGWALDTSVPLRDSLGSIIGVLATVQDITEHKRSEMILEAEKERLSVTLRSIGDGVITTDVEGRILMFNPVAEILTGSNYDDVLGKPLYEVFSIFNESIKKTKENLVEKVLKTGNIVELENNTFLLSKESAQYQITGSISPIQNKKGETEGVILVFKDISEQILLQEQVHQHSKMEAIGQLAGGMAHDFNNMLSGIFSSAQLLKRPKRNLDEKSLKYVDLILQSAERAAELIANLLSFGRKDNLTSSVVDINQVIEETFLITNKTIDRKIVTSFEKNAQNSFVSGDRTRLQNVILNLCINASHAMEDGGLIKIITQNISIDQSHCDKSTFEITPGEFCKIDIIDNGSGIKSENINKIYEPFFTTKEQGKGTGLGLSAVYGTIFEHKGEILVQSEIGFGTSFSILLPSTEETTEIKITETAPFLGSGTILLVDDEEINRALNRDILEALGYQVLLAADGLDAINLFRKKHNHIDLVLMDMIMPKMNGTEAFYKMKEIDENCSVIIVSGYTKNENIKKLIENGLSGFMSKPFTISEISRLLDDVQKKKQ